jgi:LysM repeat protein
VVRAGDTLAAVAARTGVPTARLIALNPSLQPTALFIGQRIRLR